MQWTAKKTTNAIDLGSDFIELDFPDGNGSPLLAEIRIKAASHDQIAKEKLAKAARLGLKNLEYTIEKIEAIKPSFKYKIYILIFGKQS